MFRKVLLTSISLSVIHSTQATQSPIQQPPAVHPNQPAHPTHHDANNPTSQHENHDHIIHCPPDNKAWIITEGMKKYMIIEKTGQKINLGHAHHHGGTHHEGDLQHPQSEDDRNKKRNPLLTAEEEALVAEIQAHGIGSLYDRKGQKEFGKEYKGDKYPHGVYFKAESGTKDYKPGLWVLDPEVKPHDLAGKKIPTVPKPTKAHHEAAPQEPAKKHDVVQPGAVGLTVRTNTVQTNPETKTVELSQGAANVAQTGLTGQDAPKIDVPASVPPAPPAPPAPPSSTRATS